MHPFLADEYQSTPFSNLPSEALNCTSGLVLQLNLFPSENLLFSQRIQQWPSLIPDVQWPCSHTWVQLFSVCPGGNEYDLSLGPPHSPLAVLAADTAYFPLYLPSHEIVACSFSAATKVCVQNLSAPSLFLSS